MSNVGNLFLRKNLVHLIRSMWLIGNRKNIHRRWCLWVNKNAMALEWNWIYRWNKVLSNIDRLKFDVRYSPQNGWAKFSLGFHQLFLNFGYVWSFRNSPQCGGKPPKKKSKYFYHIPLVLVASRRNFHAEYWVRLMSIAHAVKYTFNSWKCAFAKCPTALLNRFY